MSTLGILAFTTARADFSLAEKYAATVEERYALEQEGQRFLLEVSKTWKSGAGLGALDGIEEEDGVYYRTFTNGGRNLIVGIIGEDSGIRVVEWRMQKDWEPEEGMGNLWLGE
jgi:hypothetical protein